MPAIFQISANTPVQIFLLTCNLVVLICTFAVIVAVLIDFAQFQERNRVKKEKKSIVETGTMFLFFFLFYALLRFKLGQISMPLTADRMALAVVGLLLVLVGAFVNVQGRLNLGKNWSNQIKIYADHYFVSSGMYSFVRHPLYGSIIWMFFGASLVYGNYLALLSNVVIFIPAMYFRAKQEERLLAKEFPAYKDYQKKVGMFFPKLLNKKYEKV
ncbi:MAG: isoprenylcysteine carboxylmethyltransferase family protein [Candidatus Moraniibacteriota bacterium]